MGSMTSNREAQNTAAGRPEPITTHERPLTPGEAAELGMAPGPGFADGVREALAKAPVVIVSGSLHAAAADDEDADIAYPVRHHARRFVRFFAAFLAFSAFNLALMFLGVHGALPVAAFVGIVSTGPAFFYHEVKGLRAAGCVDVFLAAVRGVLGRKARPSNG